MILDFLSNFESGVADVAIALMNFIFCILNDTTEVTLAIPHNRYVTYLLMLNILVWINVYGYMAK